MPDDIAAADLMLHRDHHRAGMERIEGLLSGGEARRRGIRTGIKSGLYAMLGYVCVAAAMGAARLWEGGDSGAELLRGGEMLVLAIPLLPVVGLAMGGWAWLSFRREVMAALRRIRFRIDEEFEGQPFKLHLWWNGLQLGWLSKRGTGAIPLRALNGWSDDETLILLYLGRDGLLPVPVEQMDTESLDDLRRTLREAKIPERWDMPAMTGGRD